MTRVLTCNMAESRAVHECLFCPQRFGSAADKDDHVLEHFAQEICIDCDQNLIRIGGKLYTLHDAVTCVKREIKSDEHTGVCVVDQPVLSSNDVKIEGQSNELEQDSQSIDYQNEQLDNSMLDWIESTNSDDIHRIEQHQNTLDDGMQIKIKPELVQMIQTEKHDSIIAEIGPVENADSHSNHRDRKSGKVSIACELCGKILGTKSSLRTHKLLLHSAPGTIFCSICRKFFSTQQELNEHRPACTLKKRDQMRKYLDKMGITKKVRIVCDRKTVECKICGKILTNTSVSTHKLLKHSSPDTILCRICHKIFPTQQQLNEHRPQCTSKKRATEEALRNKRNQDSEKIGPEDISGFQCYVCNMEFKLRLRLRYHMRNTHLPVEKVVCTICGKVVHPDALQRHMNSVHVTGPGFYKCNMCSSAFRSSAGLANHKRRKHDPNFKQFECDLCERKFNYVYSLQKHQVLAHSPPGTKFCRICARIYSTEAELNEHKAQCEKKSKEKTTRNLKIHNCPICGIGIKGSFNLYRHIRKVHKQEPVKSK